MTNALDSITWEQINLTFRRKGKYVTFLTQANRQMAPVMKNNLTVQLFKQVEKGPKKELGMKH